jgi:hypothetical protein
MTELKQIEGYEKYFISRDGNVISRKGKKDLIMKQHIRGKTSPYLCVNLSKNGKKKKFFVHILVGKAFIPNPNNYTCIDHINRNKLDNRIENLRWADFFINNNNRGLHKNNKLKEKYIIYVKTKNRFRFQIQRKDLKISKSFKTLEEAIAYRDLTLNNL